MKNLTALILFTTLISGAVKASTVKQVYSGTAKNNSGKILYLEKHETLLSKEGRVLEATTEYKKENGEVFGKLSSNFKESLTAPNYKFEDLRDKSAHGLDLLEGKYVLWKKVDGQPREEKVIDPKNFAAKTLIVGCQGLHYYLVSNLEKLDKNTSIPIKYLIPGKLDYYSFHLSVAKEDESQIQLKVRVDNLFLRVFVDSLELTYSKKDRRLISYKGLSNIPDDNGSMQNVDLRYFE